MQRTTLAAAKSRLQGCSPVGPFFVDVTVGALGDQRTNISRHRALSVRGRLFELGKKLITDNSSYSVAAQALDIPIKSCVAFWK